MARRKKAAPEAPALPPVETPASTPKARADTTTAPTSKCYVLRVWEDFEKGITGLDFDLDLSGDLFAAFATKLRVNDRIYLPAWGGGTAIDRARVVVVREIRHVMGPAVPSLVVHVEQTWGWKKGAPAVEVALNMLSLVPEPGELPVFPAKVATALLSPECTPTPVTCFLEAVDRPVRLDDVVIAPAPSASVSALDALKNLLGR